MARFAFWSPEAPPVAPWEMPCFDDVSMSRSQGLLDLRIQVPMRHDRLGFLDGLLENLHQPIVVPLRARRPYVEPLIFPTIVRDIPVPMPAKRPKTARKTPPDRPAVMTPLMARVEGILHRLAQTVREQIRRSHLIHDLLIHDPAAELLKPLRFQQNIFGGG